jgi:hypothetical protein
MRPSAIWSWTSLSYVILIILIVFMILSTWCLLFDNSVIWLVNYLVAILLILPITVAARSKASTVFARSNAGIVGSNPTWGMDVRLCLFWVCVRYRPCDGLITRPRSPTECLGLRNWSETKRFTYAPCSKWSNRNKSPLTSIANFGLCRAVLGWDFKASLLL